MPADIQSSDGILLPLLLLVVIVLGALLVKVHLHRRLVARRVPAAKVEEYWADDEEKGTTQAGFLI